MNHGKKRYDEQGVKALLDLPKTSKLAGLHVHSEHSFLDGYSTTDMIAQRAAELGQSAIAITDHGECGGHLQFEKSCKKVGVRPLFGMEGYVVDSTKRVKAEKDRKNSHYCVWAKNNKGLKNLWTITSLAYMPDNFYYRPLASWDMLEEYKDGLIVSDGCMLTEVAQSLINDDIDRARQVVGKYLDIFDDNFVMELHTFQLVNPQSEEDIALNAKMAKMNQGKAQIAQEMGVPLVVVNDAHYAWREDWEEHQIVWAMSTNKSDQTEERGEAASWIMSESEMIEWMSNNSGIPRSVTEEAIRNTSSVVADRCDVEIERKLHIPGFSTKEGEDERIFFESLDRGWQEKIVPMGLDAEKLKEYEDRVAYEVSVLKSKDFLGYFNVVRDYVAYAKSSDPDGIRGPFKDKKPWLLSPGRGSGSGSLVSYLMGITELDPIKYGLIFERFLNPDRGLAVYEIELESGEKIKLTADKKVKLKTGELIPISEVEDGMELAEVPQ